MMSNKHLNLYTARIMKSGETRFGVESIEVLAENSNWYVLNTDHYDKVTKTKTFEFTYCLIGVPKIHKKDNELDCFTDDPEFGNGVHYKLYTEKTKRPATIRKEIEEFLNEKFGYLANIDLSFIK